MGTGLLTPSLVDGLAQELGHVESVEDMQRFAAPRRDDSQKRFPHVARDESDLLRTLLAEHVEERMEARLGSILGDVQQPPSAVVDLVD